MEFINKMKFEAGSSLLNGSDQAEFFVRTGSDSVLEDYGEEQTNPFEDLNVIEFNCGEKAYRYSGNQLKSVKLHEESGLLNDELAANAVTAEVIEKEAIHVAFDTPIYAKRDGKIKGIFYNAKITETGLQTKKIYAESLIAILDYEDHQGGVYDGTTTVGNLIAEIMPVGSYEIDEEISQIKVYGYLPYASKRSNLLQIVIATGAAIRNREDGKIVVTSIKSNEGKELPSSRVFEGGTVNESTPMTKIELTEHTYATGGDLAKLYEGTITGDTTIKFSEPAYDLSIENGTIMEQSANHARIQGKGNVVLTGRKYIHITRILEKGESSATSKTYQVKSAYLVNALNSNSVLNRLYAYARCNRIISQDIFVTEEKTGDMVTVIDPYSGEPVQAAIKELDHTMSASIKARAKFLTGYVPQGISTGYKNRLLITQTSIFVVPYGVKEIGAVLIGGGQGGPSGYPGEKGESGWGSGGSGGNGGDGAAGGDGGKVLQINLPVTQGESISAVIGEGGAGAAFTEGGDVGQSGGETKFGGYSSENGATLKYGYVDLYSGQTYAIAGETGIDGAKGGSGGNSSDGGVGGNVGVYAGGAGGAHVSNSRGYGGGGGGGGAAYGANGSDGEDADYDRTSGIFDGGPGGSGATPVKSGKGTVYGQGGQGGHGGGGGGGGGTAHHQNGQSQEWAGSGGAAGSGGTGGDGANGCVIIYY